MVARRALARLTLASLAAALELWFNTDMGDLRRRHPRASCACPGELIARGRNQRHAITICSASEGGLAGDLLSTTAAALAVGTSVTILLPAFGSTVELPGRIAWARRGDSAASFGRVGISLFVEVAPARTRRWFTRWLREAL